MSDQENKAPGGFKATLRSRLTAGMLLVALVPLTLSMSLSLWDHVNQTRQLAIEAAHNELRSMANELSAYFDRRIGEINTYARTPVIRSLAPEQFTPFMKREIEHHGGIYEKFLIGRPDGQYYYTAGGNPFLGGVASFNDTSPEAKSKTIAKRDYWLHTLGENTANEALSYVSNPMISYTTGAKQIMVAASIVDDTGKVSGMFGGSLPWENIEQLISRLRNNLEVRLPWDVRMFLISPEGIYWYHWDPEKVVHIQTDSQGQPVLNELGEKVSVRTRITDSPDTTIAAIGRNMLGGLDGYTRLTETDSGETFMVFYAPVKSAGYSVGIQVPYQQINAPIADMISSQGVVTLAAIIASIFIAFTLAKRITQPISSLRDAADDFAHGKRNQPLPPGGTDEVGILTRTFNGMITALQERERSLAESEERFALAMKGSNDGLWDWNVETGEIYYSPSWKSMLGYGEDEILDNLDSFESRLHPDDTERVKQHIKDYLFGDINNYDVEMRMRHKDGHYVDILSRGFVVHRESDQQPIRFVGTHTNISERKRVEASLIEARNAAELANQAKSRFLSNMSHELRTPLNAIIGFADILAMDPDEHFDSQEKRHLSEISSAGWHLLDLINDILDLARIEVGALRVQLAPVRLADILQECASALTPAAEQRQVRISCSSACDNYISADRLRLKQVLLNLLSNAIKYNQEGGKVDIECIMQDSDHLQISVNDTGNGIPSDRLKEIFEPFNRLDALDHCIEGTGVGLSIARHLMHLMGGEIGVDSREGIGSTFWITLPLAEVPAADHATPVDAVTPPEHPAPRTRQYSVLCVEDNPANLELLKRILAGTDNLHIIEATSGPEGLKLALQHKPDLILLDINLPGINGTEVMQQLRNEKTTHKTPIIALSANALQSDIDEALRLGFDDYLTKPFDIRVLQTTVHAVLSKHHLSASRETP